MNTSERKTTILRMLEAAVAASGGLDYTMSICVADASGEISATGMSSGRSSAEVMGKLHGALHRHADKMLTAGFDLVRANHPQALNQFAAGVQRGLEDDCDESTSSVSVPLSSDAPTTGGRSVDGDEPGASQ
jgi:hypothetical protein